MSVRLFCKLASGAPFHLIISLLYVECWWQETPINQFSVGLVRRHICKSSSQYETSAGYFMNKNTVWYSKKFKTNPKQTILKPKSACHINKNPICIVSLSF